MEIYVIATLIITASALCLYSLYQMSFGNKRTRQTDITEMQLSKLSQQHFILSRSIDIFRDVGSQYFSTLNENGFTKLCMIQEGLGKIIEYCSELQQKNKNSELEEIVRFIYIKQARGEPPLSLAKVLNSNLSILEDWGQNSKNLTIKLSESIAEASDRMKQIGSEERRKRKKTILSLTSVKQSMATYE